VDDVGNAGGPYAGTVLPGSASISNSQCTIAAAGSSLSGTGNTLTVTLNISFSNFSGNRIIYAAARSATANSGWQAIGSVTVP